MRNENEGSDVISDIRVNKFAWFDDNDHKVIRTVSERTGDISGLDMSSSDKLQVANYGIGGHYEPHHDYFSEGSVRVANDRIATVLYYVKTN